MPIMMQMAPKNDQMYCSCQVKCCGAENGLRSTHAQSACTHACIQQCSRNGDVSTCGWQYLDSVRHNPGACGEALNHRNEVEQTRVQVRQQQHRHQNVDHFHVDPMRGAELKFVTSTMLWHVGRQNNSCVILRLTLLSSSSGSNLSELSTSIDLLIAGQNSVRQRPWSDSYSFMLLQSSATKCVTCHCCRCDYYHAMSITTPIDRCNQQTCIMLSVFVASTMVALIDVYRIHFVIYSLWTCLLWRASENSPRFKSENYQNRSSFLLKRLSSQRNHKRIMKWE